MFSLIWAWINGWANNGDAGDLKLQCANYDATKHHMCFAKQPWKNSLRWRHNGCDSVSNHQPRECLLRRLIRRTSKKTSKLRVTGLCAGNSPETGEFPAQMVSNAEMFPFDDVIMYSQIVIESLVGDGRDRTTQNVDDNFFLFPWWRNHVETFSALPAFCAGNSPVPSEFPSQRPVTRSFDVSFDLRMNKRLSKQSWGRWFETPSRSLWRQCNAKWPRLSPHPYRLICLATC